MNKIPHPEGCGMTDSQGESDIIKIANGDFDIISRIQQLYYSFPDEFWGSLLNPRYVYISLNYHT